MHNEVNLSQGACIELQGLVWMNTPFSHLSVPTVLGCLLIGMQVTPVWVRVALVGEHTVLRIVLLPKNVPKKSAVGWSRVAVIGTWVQHDDADFILVCIKIKTTCFTWKTPFGGRGDLAYLDPSLKVDPIILTRITNVLCALTGFVSYNIVRVYTCTKYNLIEMLHKNVNKKNQMIYGDFFIKV